MEIPKGHSGNHDIVIADYQYFGKPCNKKEHVLTLDGKKGSIRMVTDKNCAACKRDWAAKARRKAFQKENGRVFLMRSQLDDMMEAKRLQRELGEVWDDA